MRKIHSAVIGAGFIGPAHVEAVRRLGFVEVDLLAEIDPQVAAQKASQLGLARFTSNLDEVMQDPAVDVVHICVPNNQHYSLVKRALEAGKHVICEKPLAMTSQEAEELVALAAYKKRVGAVHFNNRGYPLTQHARSLIRAGELGEVLSIQGVYLQDWLLFPTDYNWRLEAEQSGDSRAVADLGSHWFDLAEFLTGLAVTEVCADFATFHPVRQKPLRPLESFAGKILKPEDYQAVPINTEDYATVMARFGPRARGVFTVSQAAAGRKNYLLLEIYGTKKSVSWNSENPNELWIGRRDGNNEVVIKDPSLLDPSIRAFSDLPGGHTEGFDTAIKQVMRRIYTFIAEDGLEQGRTPDFPTFADGLRELRLCEAIVRSARERRWITVEPSPA